MQSRWELPVAYGFLIMETIALLMLCSCAWIFVCVFGFVVTSRCHKAQSYISILTIALGSDAGDSSVFCRKAALWCNGTVKSLQICSNLGGAKRMVHVLEGGRG